MHRLRELDVEPFPQRIVRRDLLVQTDVAARKRRRGEHPGRAVRADVPEWRFGFERAVDEPGCFVLALAIGREEAERHSAPGERVRLFGLLALSLEVGEHLPAGAAAELVRSVTTLAPLALFSAAFPGQGGTNHVNEQWPTYWHALFARRDFVALDPIRPAVWQDERVAWWYRCNTYLYAHRDALRARPGLAELARRYEANPLTLTHKRVIRRLAGTGRLAKYRTKLAMRLLG